MPLTKSFKELVRGRAAGDPKFVAALSREEVDASHRSPVMASIHEMAEGLHAAGVMNTQTMRKFDEACLTPQGVRNPSPEKS